MFRTPSRDCEPAPLLLARVLRTALEPCGPLFGDDVGAPLSGEEAPSMGIDTQAVQYADKATPSMPSELKNFLTSTMGAKRGVLAGLPAIAGLSAKPQERVLALGSKAVAGHAWWWLWWLKRTPFSRRDSYTYRTGEVVYRVGGDATQSFDWFPGGGSYGTEPGKLAAYLNFGLTVSVREIPLATREPDFDAQVQHVTVQAYAQLEAATHGIAPAVFATMLVNNGDSYATRAGDKLGASTAADSLALTGDATRVVAVVTISQVHTFRLSDMLRAYVGMGPEENRQLAKQAIVQSAHEVCNKVHALAKMRLLKLTMTADSVVFCPELKEATGDDEWEVLGYTFRAAGFDPVAGMPHLSDYDHRLCKRLQGSEGYDVSCAYLMMMLVFLSSVRAQFPAVYSMLFEAVQGFGHWKDAVIAAPDKLESFRNMFQRTFVHTRVERGPLPKALLESTIDDFVAIVSKINKEPQYEATVFSLYKRASFHSLLLWLLGTRSYTPSGEGSDEDIATERMQHRKDMARLESVQSARHARRLARRSNK